MSKGENTCLPDGQRIKTLRSRKGLSQKGLAKVADVALGTIQNMERGKPVFPSYLKQVAEALDVTLIELCKTGSQLPPDGTRGIPESLIEFVCSFDTFIEDRRRNFTGRDFVFEALDVFLEDSDNHSGYFLIQADPGIGKSALMAELIINRRLPVYHFNIATQGINTARQFLGNVCARLVGHFGLPFTHFPEDFQKDGAFLNKLLREAGDRLGDEDQLIIAVDALDEVETDGSGRQANPLFLPAALPRNVYFVLTARHRDNIRLPAAHIKPFTLEHDAPKNRDDIRAFISLYLNRTGITAWMKKQKVSAEQFIDQIDEKSEGNFMYLRHVLPAIEKGWFSDGKVSELPRGLREYYRCHWDQMRDHDPDVFDRMYQPVVCILAAAYEPVPASQVAEWTGLGSSSVSRVLHDWAEFLHREPSSDDEPGYRLYHAAFRDYLQEEVDPGLKTYHRMIARAEVRRFRKL